jgi:hypothetical protein
MLELSLDNDGQPAQTLNLSSINAVQTLIEDSDGDTQIQVQEFGDEDKIRFDLGGTEHFVMDGPRLQVKNSSNCVFIGDGAGESTLVGASNNVFIGTDAGNANTAGDYLVGIGSSALELNTTGNSNIAVGSSALESNTGGNYNVAVGGSALGTNTTGSNNCALGVQSMFVNTTGAGNVALGRYAMYYNTTGSSNTAVGYFALVDNTTASNNSAFGKEALGSNTTGIYNVAMGNSALLDNTTGNRNVAVGHIALRDCIGNHNVAVGVDAGQQATGSDNVFIGFEAGRVTTTGSGNVFIGRSAGENSNVSNRLFIDNSSTTNPLIYGEFDTHVLKLYGRVEADGDIIPEDPATSFDLGNNVAGENWDQVVANAFVNFSDANLKHDVSEMTVGLNEVLALHPVQYRYVTDIDPGQQLRNGLIAQEVEPILPNVIVREDVDRDPQTGDVIRRTSEHLAMNYMELIPVLIKAMQEQQTIIQGQQEQIDVLSARLELLENE